MTHAFPPYYFLLEVNAMLALLIDYAIWAALAVGALAIALGVLFSKR